MVLPPFTTMLVIHSYMIPPLPTTSAQRLSYRRIINALDLAPDKKLRRDVKRGTQIPISQIPSTFLYRSFYLCVNRTECNNILSHYFTHNRVRILTCIVRTEKGHKHHDIRNFYRNIKNIVRLMIFTYNFLITLWWRKNIRLNERIVGLIAINIAKSDNSFLFFATWRHFYITIVVSLCRFY